MIEAWRYGVESVQTEENADGDYRQKQHDLRSGPDRSFLNGGFIAWSWSVGRNAHPLPDANKEDSTRYSPEYETPSNVLSLYE